MLAAGCATLGLDALVAPRFERADERGSQLRLQAPSLAQPTGAASLRVWTRVQNPNPVGLTVTEITGRLYVEGVPIDVTFPLGLPLEARADSVIPLDVRVTLGDVPRLAEVAGKAVLSGESLGYRIEGTIAVDAGALGTPRFGPSTILSGELSAIPN